MPDELAGAKKRNTTTQASRAWGEPPITLRCGVEPPGPTTDRCVTAIDDSGESIDWVMREIGEPGVEENTWHFTTYGRDPAIEVIVPGECAGPKRTGGVGTLRIDHSQFSATRECVSSGRIGGSMLLNSTRPMYSNECVRSDPRGREGFRHRAMTWP